MDSDPPSTVDYIFYREGKGTSSKLAVRLVHAKLMGHSHLPQDHTIFGSDHFPLVAEFEFQLNHHHHPSAAASLS
jgi:mRNA deadenylase 3'-5' endonuclease subunit Ccr4